MNFTKRQLGDLETIIYFSPQSMSDIEVTDEDKKMFFEISEKGLHKDLSITGMSGRKTSPGLSKLLEGKRWRGIHVHELYEEGILDGSMPYFVILEDMPRSVIDFLKKEMFKGYDAEIIERVYQELIKNK